MKRTKSKRLFRIRYARVVIMETTVKAANRKAAAVARLPGVFEGIPTEAIGSHIEEVVDYEPIFELKELES